MRTISFDHFGDADVLRLDPDAPEPVPGPGEVVARVAYAGLNPLDYKIRDGSSGRAQGLSLPAGTGREFSGTLVTAADDVDLPGMGLAIGDRVFGMRDLSDARGTCQEVVAIAADSVAPVASEGVMAPAAGLALAGLTAISAVEDNGQVGGGDTVLIHGGSGGVGQLLIPLAREAGASTVWATGRAENADRLRQLGAVPIAYDEEDWQQRIRSEAGRSGVDVVLDTHYFSTFVPSLDVLAPGGRIVPLPSLADLTPALDRGIDASIPRPEIDRTRLDRLMRGLVAGRYPLEVSEVFGLERIAEAHRVLEAGHTRGKIVVDLAGGA